MEPVINLTLSLSVVNAALNALEQQGHNVGNAIAAIKNQAVQQLQAQPGAAEYPSPPEAAYDAPQLDLPDLGSIEGTPI